MQGFEQFKWQRRKVWQHFKTRLKETYSKLELWRNSLKKIEGNFGTGVVAYFLFLKWLMFLNLSMFLLILSFIILPVLLMEQPENSSNTSTTFEISDISKFIIDIIQGTGQFNETILFYGMYKNRTLVDINGIYYDLPLAYILTAVALFVFSLVSIVKSAAKDFKERLVEGEGQFYHYCNLIFAGWDFCIHNEKAADIKHKALFNEIKACLESKRLEDERMNRTRQEKIRLAIVRAIINIIVLTILLGSMALIIYVFQYSNEQLKTPNLDKNLALLLEFLPSISITGLNIIVPILFKTLIGFEHYSPLFVIRLTLLRTIILKLLSLGVLVFNLFTVITCVGKDCNTQALQCWETYVGQQIYKLVITDFATHFVLTFFVNFPRALIAKKFDNKFAKLIGEQQYDLPKHVLDVVYSQTLCWLGVFFVPLLPAISTIMCFFMFYIKKFTCLVNSTPASQVYRASRSNSMFMFVLLIAHCLTVIPIALAIAEIQPSCGPFEGKPFIWSYVIEQFGKLPLWITTLVFLIGTAWFSIPVFIILVLFLYYYSAVIDANKHMVEVLKNQLVLEGHDKQFLLNRLVEFSKQQQEYQKRIRNSEMMRERDRIERDRMERVTASN